MINTFFFYLEIIIVIFFSIYDLTIHEDKKYLAFFAEKNIRKILRSKIVRYTCYY